MIKKIVLLMVCLTLVGLTVSYSSEKASPQMVLIKGGTFEMGADNVPNDEEPVHDVTVSSFYIGKYEVTQEEWKTVMGDNTSHFKGDNLPVEKVSWYQAIEYCNKRSKMEGRTPCYSGAGDDIACNFEADGYRLPSETEWEFAAIGGNKSKGYRYSGGNIALEVGWFEENSSYRTHPVGQKKPNELGIYDMSGNIWEWCFEWYGADYYKNSPAIDPRGPEKGKQRAYRGGGICGRDYFTRTRARYSLPAKYQHSDMGLRVVCNAAGKLPAGMVKVDGGTFKMGSTIGGRQGERPKHKVTVSDFYMAKYETTQQEWMDVMGQNPCYFCALDAPVNAVSWYDAVDYCNKLSKKEGLTPCYSKDGDKVICNFEADGYRLPTEAEWEYTCRGGAKSQNFKFSGGNEPDEIAWHAGNSGYRHQSVGEKKPNELGIYDLNGNANEWCWDWFSRDYYPESPAKDPRGPVHGVRRVMRGGSSLNPPSIMQPHFRTAYKPYRPFITFGFRVARSSR